MTAEARRDVNRRNAQQSTGPKTEAGKARSRQNALKHGLTATVVDRELPPIEAPEPDRDPADPSWQDWVVDQVGHVRVQIVRAQGMETQLRDQAARRAETLWETDRRVEAEDRGADLKRLPGRTVAKLRQTPQGCDWLMERWQILARAAEAKGAWNEAQHHLALDLLGTPIEGRTDCAESTVDPQADGGPSLVALARAALADLAGQRTRAEGADEVEQTLAAADCRDTPTRELARLRRYELALHKRLQWLMTELRGSAPGQTPVVSPPMTAPNPPPRNEAIPSPPAPETKPTAADSASILPPGFGLHGLDLTRPGHQNRRDRRRTQRQHRLA